MRPLEAKKWFTAICLTEEWEKHWVVVRHDKQVDTGKSGAGFKVTKWLSQVILLPTAVNEHLRTTRKISFWSLRLEMFSQKTLWSFITDTYY